MPNHNAMQAKEPNNDAGQNAKANTNVN